VEKRRFERKKNEKWGQRIRRWGHSLIEVEIKAQDQLKRKGAFQGRFVRGSGDRLLRRELKGGGNGVGTDN